MSGKTKLLSFSVCSVLFISALTGCNININTAQPTSASETTAQVTTVTQTEQTDSNTASALDTETETTTPNTAMFEEVYNEYSEALISKTPVLINEFLSYTGTSTEGDYAETMLEELKDELSDIFNEGLARFVIVVSETGADNDEYEFWHNKLEDVYNNQIDTLLYSCSSVDGVEYGEDIDY